MPRIRNQVPRAHVLSSGVLRAPLAGLSCPYSKRDVNGPADVYSGFHDAFGALGTQDASSPHANARSGDAAPWRWRDSVTTNYWNPPTSERQHARQRILAVIVAFVLAAILAQARW